MYTNDLYLENSRAELTLENNCSYSINDNQIQINIDQIHNNRESNNISGSLCIELWALPEVYNGNSFTNAHCMSSVNIGEIYGQHFLDNCQYDLILNNPPVGSWNLSLMLREYNGQAYETIDYRNFNVPYLVEGKSTCDDKKESKCVTELETYKTKNEKIEKKELKSTPKVIVKATEKIDLNSASESEIVKLKGVSKNVASSIVASRPFKSSNDLLKIKGIGKKLLENILEQSKF